MMAKLLNPDALGSLSTAKSLALIQTLSKLCNSPSLLSRKGDDNAGINAAVKLMPANASAEDVSLSGGFTHTPLHALLKERQGNLLRSPRSSIKYIRLAYSYSHAGLTS
jgi:hypothetical protein